MSMEAGRTSLHQKRLQLVPALHSQLIPICINVSLEGPYRSVHVRHSDALCDRVSRASIFPVVTGESKGRVAVAFN